MIYELRTYKALPGRLPKLLERFENHTTRIWERHDIRPVGFWTTLIGESNNHLIYILAWDSMADRETKWAAFQADPDWISARSASESDGPIVADIASEFLAPTAFSALR